MCRKSIVTRFLAEIKRFSYFYCDFISIFTKNFRVCAFTMRISQINQRDIPIRLNYRMTEKCISAFVQHDISHRKHSIITY